jgi:hypothetical protein
MKKYDKIEYDLDIIPKQQDIPYLWDFFNCKSKHIIQDGCDMVGLDWADVFTEVKDIYYNGRKIRRYGGDIPSSFLKKISKAGNQMDGNTTHSEEDDFIEALTNSNYSNIVNTKLKPNDFSSQMNVDDAMQAYLQGKQLDWSKLYGNTSIKKLHLPGYCFDLKPYWFDEEISVASNGIAELTENI